MSISLCEFRGGSLEGLGQYIEHQLPINLNNFFGGQGNSKRSCWYSYQFDCFDREEPFPRLPLQIHSDSYQLF